jgi:outer membrane autotransporter protein
MMVGIDGSFGAGFSAGLAAGRTHSNATMTALGGYLDGRENLVAAYGSWEAGNGLYGAGRISYASIRNGANRELLLGTTLTALAGGRTGHVTLGSLEGGKAIDLGGSTVTPYVSVSDLHLLQNGFTEQGSAMGLTAPSQSHDATFGTAGVRYGYGFDWSLGHSWLAGYLAWRRAFSGADLGMDATFNGVPNSTFEAEGQNLPRNLAIAGVGLNTEVNARWSWYVDADYQAGSEGAHEIEADLGVKFGF